MLREFFGGRTLGIFFVAWIVIAAVLYLYFHMSSEDRLGFITKARVPVVAGLTAFLFTGGFLAFLLLFP